MTDEIQEIKSTRQKMQNNYASANRRFSPVLELEVRSVCEPYFCTTTITPIKITTILTWSLLQ